MRNCGYTTNGIGCGSKSAIIGNRVRDVCSITKPTVREVMEEFTRIPLIDGKTFWELENELEWV